MVQVYENNIVKKIAQKELKPGQIIERRNKDNDKILESVIIKNGLQNKEINTIGNNQLTDSKKNSIKTRCKYLKFPEE